MELYGSECQRDGRVLWQEKELRQDVGLGEEDGVGVALEAGEDVGTKILGND